MWVKKIRVLRNLTYRIYMWDVLDEIAFTEVNRDLDEKSKYRKALIDSTNCKFHNYLAIRRAFLEHSAQKEKRKSELS